MTSETGRVGDWLRVIDGEVPCARRHTTVSTEECRHCGFGTRIAPDAVEGEVVRCTARAEGAERMPAKAKVRVLVADDDSRSVLTLARLLREDGFDVEVAMDGAAAIARLSRDPLPDVLVTDVRMPYVDGASVAFFARARAASLPILVVTGYPDSVPRLCRDLVPRPAVLTKPVDYAQLARAITMAAEATETNEPAPDAEPPKR